MIVGLDTAVVNDEIVKELSVSDDMIRGEIGAME